MVDSRFEAGASSATIRFHYDGPIADNHNLTVRTLSITLKHLQSAIDRAYLDVTYGNVMKYQRLQKEDYPKVDFLALAPSEGGFIMDLVSDTGRLIADRLAGAVLRAYEQRIVNANEEHRRLLDQAHTRAQVYAANPEVPTFQEFIQSEEGKLIRAYGERSIVKEIDQVLSTIRHERYEGSTLDLAISGSRAHPVVTFDSPRAAEFHKVVSARRLGDPLSMRMVLRSLDAAKPGQVARGKATNLDTGREFNFEIPSATVFNKLPRIGRAHV